jgi:hypothetical protein
MFLLLLHKRIGSKYISFIRGLDQSTRGEQAAKPGIDMKRSGVWINRVEKRKKLVLTI